VAHKSARLTTPSSRTDNTSPHRSGCRARRAWTSRARSSSPPGKATESRTPSRSPPRRYTRASNRSLSVTIPTSWSRSRTSRHPILCFRNRAAASSTGASGVVVCRSRTMTSDTRNRSGSSTCRAVPSPAAGGTAARMRSVHVTRPTSLVPRRTGRCRMRRVCMRSRASRRDAVGAMVVGLAVITSRTSMAHAGVRFARSCPAPTPARGQYAGPAQALGIGRGTDFRHRARTRLATLGASSEAPGREPRAQQPLEKGEHGRVAGENPGPRFPDTFPPPARR
jgi:hypothetical protein